MRREEERSQFGREGVEGGREATEEDVRVEMERDWVGEDERRKVDWPT